MRERSNESFGGSRFEDYGGGRSRSIDERLSQDNLLTKRDMMRLFP